MSVLKRVTAFLTAVSFAAAFTACGSNTTEALEVDGYQVPAGVYIYFANTAYNNALNQLAEEQPDLDTTDVNAVKSAMLEGVDVRTWVENKATEMCVDFVVTEQKFEELGLTLSAEDESYLDMMMEYYWAGSQESMERNGISEASFSKIIASSYKSDAIFEYYYGIGGEEGVTEEELYDYYKENNIRCQYVRFNLTDGEGNMLKSDGKAEMMDMVKEFQKRVEDAYEEGGIEAVMTEMNYVQEDYNYYVTSISEEAAGVEEPSTTTPRETSAAETTTAAEEDADSDEAAETTADEETNAEEVADEETPLEDGDEEANIGEDDDENAEGEAGDVDDIEETPEANEEVTPEEEEGETDVASDEDAVPDAADEETPVEEEATTEAEIEDIDIDDDYGIEPYAIAEEDGVAIAETETETVTYDNERIISVVHEEDYEDEEDIYYNPSEKTYKKLLGIDAKDYGRPYIVEEDEQYYLVVRYDIEDRMTEDDLWSENAIDNTAYAKYSKDFEDLLDTWAASANTIRNNAAYKRYDPYKFDFS